MVIKVCRQNNVPSPLDSSLEAVLTVSPNKQYLGIVRPTTPETTGPTGFFESLDDYVIIDYGDDNDYIDDDDYNEDDHDHNEFSHNRNNNDDVDDDYIDVDNDNGDNDDDDDDNDDNDDDDDDLPTRV